MLIRRRTLLALVLMITLSVASANPQSTSTATSGTAIWVNSSGDLTFNSCEMSRNAGDTIQILFRVEERTNWVKIVRYDTQGNRLVYDGNSGVPQQVNARETVRALSITLPAAGRETFILQAQTVTSRVLTAVCTFPVIPPGVILILPATPPADSPIGDITIAQLGIGELNRGCNQQYQPGQSITVLFRVLDETGNASLLAVLENIDRSGEIKEILRQFVPVSQTFRIDGTISGTSGSNTLALRVRMNNGSWVSSFCRMIVG